MSDVFNNTNTTRVDGEIASSEFAKVSIGSTPSSLTQEFRAVFSQPLETVSQLGDPAIYWIPGRPQGQVNVSRLVANKGFFSGWTSGKCGKLQLMRVNVEGGRCDYKGTGSLLFQNSVVETFSVDFTTQTYGIREGMQVRISGMATG